MNCTQCGSPADPGQLCPSCGTFQPVVATGTPAWGQASSAPPPPPGMAPPSMAPPGLAQGGLAQGGYGSAYPGQPGSALPSYGSPSAGPSYGAPMGPPPGQPYGQSYSPAMGTMLQGPKTNGMAIASLICSLAGILCGVTAILGVIFGFVARGQIKRSQGMQTGGGLALAGIIIGLIICAGIVAWIVLVAAFGNFSTTSN
jgi:hypothetical protein